MSFEAMRWALYRQGLTVKAKVVLIALADCCNARGGNTCWPSIEHVMGVTGLSRSSVIRAIEELANTQPPTIEKDCSLGRVTRYTLTVDGAEAKMNTKGAHHNGDERGQSDADPCQPDTPTRVNLTPHPCQPDTPTRVSLTHPTRVNLTPHPCQPDTPPVSDRHPPCVSLTPVTSKEPVKEPVRESPLGGKRESSSRARENSESGTRTLSQAPSGGLSLDETMLDWQGIAQTLRPEIAADPCWQKFRIYHQGKTLTTEAWKAEWQLWVLRERDYCPQNDIISHGNSRAPGRLTAMLGSQAIDAASYEVLKS